MEQTLIQAVLAVLTAIGEWVGTAFTSWVFPMFWTAEAGLTILGIMAVMAVGIAIIFLLIGVVQNFFRLRS